MAESAYERARRLSGRDFYDRADYNRFVATIPAGQKPHKHEFYEAEEEVVGPNPHGPTVIPCSTEGCTAELHGGENGPDLVHEGTTTKFKGKVVPR